MTFKGFKDFDSMSSISKSLVSRLKEKFVIDYGEIKVGWG
jgi:adenine C2-methylase RlmN of 23S rRNA A2503 and tRNA A37